MTEHQLLQIIRIQRQRISELKDERLEMARKLRRAEEEERRARDECSDGE